MLGGWGGTPATQQSPRPTGDGKSADIQVQGPGANTGAGGSAQASPSAQPKRYSAGVRIPLPPFPYLPPLLLCPTLFKHAALTIQAKVEAIELRDLNINNLNLKGYYFGGRGAKIGNIGRTLGPLVEGAGWTLVVGMALTRCIDHNGFNKGAGATSQR